MVDELGRRQLGVRAPWSKTMSEATRIVLELGDIQSGVLRPRPSPYAATYILLRIDDRKAGRDLMRRLAAVVNSCADTTSKTGVPPAERGPVAGLRPSTLAVATRPRRTTPPSARPTSSASPTWIATVERIDQT
jgi:deferrochelatase/peroxidase EfeB